MIVEQVRNILAMFVAFGAVLFVSACAHQQTPADRVPPGPSSFLFSDWPGPALTVWTYAPADAGADAPVVFVMHGVQRNGEEYRDAWVDLAEANGFILVVPEFPRDAFPGAENYNLGGVFDDTGARTDPAIWAYSAIEPIFDAVRADRGLTATDYALYGHSAGAQFAHRFLFYVPDARVRALVAANAGWYQMPDFAEPFPYGLDGSQAEEADLVRYLAQPMVVLLGDADTGPDHPSLRRTPEADRQGLHRYARGLAFFETGRAEAERRGVAFGWRLAFAPGVDHDNTRMAPYAAASLVP